MAIARSDTPFSNTRDPADLYNQAFFTDQLNGQRFDAGDLAVLFHSWEGGDAVMTVTDDQGVTWTMPTLAKVKHTTEEFYLGAWVIWNAADTPERVGQVVADVLVPNRSTVGGRYSGARTASNPFIEVKSSEGSAVSSLASPSINPGAAGRVISATAVFGGGRTFTGADLRLDGDGRLALYDKSASGATTITGSWSGGTAKALTLALAFVDNTATSGVITVSGTPRLVIV